MTLVLTTGIFAVAMAGMAVGVVFKGRDLRGSCGGGDVVDADGNTITCGACPKADAALCPSDDPLVQLSQIGHPNPREHR